jgi:hypothetical protein
LKAALIAAISDPVPSDHVWLFLVGRSRLARSVGPLSVRSVSRLKPQALRFAASTAATGKKYGAIYFSHFLNKSGLAGALVAEQHSTD